MGRILQCAGGQPANLCRVSGRQRTTWIMGRDAEEKALSAGRYVESQTRERIGLQQAECVSRDCDGSDFVKGISL
jgi:hypothetical protein